MINKRIKNRTGKSAFARKSILLGIPRPIENHIKSRFIVGKIEAHSREERNYRKKSMLIVRKILFNFQMKSYSDQVEELMTSLPLKFDSYKDLWYSYLNLKAVMFSTITKIFPDKTIRLIKNTINRGHETQKDLYHLAGIFLNIRRVVYYESLLDNLINMVNSNHSKTISFSLEYLYEVIHERPRFAKGDIQEDIFAKKILPLLTSFKGRKLIDALYLTMHLPDNKISSENFEGILAFILKDHSNLPTRSAGELDSLIKRFR